MALCLAVSLASPARAGTGSDDGSESPFEPVIVTAARVAQTADETLAPVTVLTREDIERSQAQSLEDLFRGLPGIDIANAGGAGKATTLYMRGTNSDQVLVLVDGVKVGSATTGATAFQDIPVELIDRIEIVRGPHSSLYGSEAMGGVIQIFTRAGAGAPKASLAVGGGTYGTWQGSAGVSSGLGNNGSLSAGVSGYDTQGFADCLTPPPSNPYAGCGATVLPNTNDGYRNDSARLRLGWRFDGGSDAEVSWLHTHGNTRYEGSYSNIGITSQEVLSAKVGLVPLDFWHATLRAARSQDNESDYLYSEFVDLFDTQRTTLSWQNELELAKGQRFVLGVDHQEDEVDSSAAFALASRADTGAFGEYLGQFGAQSLQLAARRDDNEQFGIHSTGSAAWGLDLTGSLRLTASFGTAFKAPSFNELYYPNYGNPDLKPEQSHSAELGLAGRAGESRWSLNAYRTMVTDLIVDSEINYLPYNIDAARILGLEAVGSTRFFGWDLRGNVTLLDPTDEGGPPNQGNQLARRARRAGSLSADRVFGSWSAGATLRAQSLRYEDPANTELMGGYATVDLRGEYKIRRDLRLQVRIENLLDKNYETAYLYNQPGRGIYWMLRYQP
jgi:vitamin B12 transporter